MNSLPALGGRADDRGGECKFLELSFARVQNAPALEGRGGASLPPHGRTYVLKGGFDTSYREFAPRTLLLHASLERAFALGTRC